MTNKSPSLEMVIRHLRSGGHSTLFLDYDGTLLPLAATPDQAVPDDLLLDLLRELSRNQLIQVIIISGRPVSNLRTWLPNGHIVVAGIYGVEVLIDNKIIWRGASPEQNRILVAKIQESWAKLLQQRKGFILEDKGFAIALHGRMAKIEEASFVLDRAEKIARRLMDPYQFRLLTGHQFLEVIPINANKSNTVNWWLTEHPLQDNLPVYFGDDNNDEEAFGVIRRWGGLSIGVGKNYPLLQADEHLASFEDVRTWLKALILLEQ